MPLPSANKVAHSGFQTQRRLHQKSKTWVSVATEKGLVSSKDFFLKSDYENSFIKYIFKMYLHSVKNN